MLSTARNLFVLTLLSAPLLAQVSSIPISMAPGDGIEFMVDGQAFYGSATFQWPQGSKHNISIVPTAVDDTMESGNQPKTLYQFTGWTINTLVPGLGQQTQSWMPMTLIITADPSVQSIVAGFTAAYEFDVNFAACPTDGSPCVSPATIYGIGPPTGITCNFGADSPTVFIVETTSCFAPAGQTVTLLVQPNPGYIFTGWLDTPGQGNAGQAFAISYTIIGPLSVSPQFQLSRPINVDVSTEPVTLQVLLDQTPITSPASLEWGTGTVHSLGVVSPQLDATGNSWVFSSWSDGGAQSHNYTVPYGNSALSFTATFTPGYQVTFGTSPSGLSISVNGKTNPPNLTFTGAAGTKYQLSAPATQVDSQGRTNQFVSWSNGGSATQTYTQPANTDRVTAIYQLLGHLTVSSSPPGLSFTVNGKNCVSPCSFDQPPGTQMNISTASSIPLSSTSRLDFQGWQDSGSATRVYTMTSAASQTLLASYQTMYMVQAATTPATAGSVLVQPTSPDGYYPANTQLQATVSQNPGFAFRSWQGDVAGSQPVANLMVGSPKTIGAVFGTVPYLPPVAVQNAAGVTPVSAVAPGSVVSIYGLNLASNTLAGPTAQLSQTLLNVTATIGQQILPLYFVSPSQINVQLPFETPLGQQIAYVHQQGQPDVNAVFSVVANAPGIFSITHSDGTAVTASSPAAAGEILTITGTGFGPYDRNPPDGLVIPSNSTYMLVDAVTVTAGGVSGAAISYGPSYKSVGLNVATFQVPSSLPSGTSVPLNVTINGADSNQLSLFLQ
jgi:uncharacterized protein (TIGR03437 family)